MSSGSELFQVAPIRRAFAPSPGEVQWARQVVAAFEQAAAQGLSMVRLGGKFIDPPVVKRAQRLVEQGARLEPMGK